MRDGQKNSSHIDKQRPGNRYVVKGLKCGVISGVLAGVMSFVAPPLIPITPGVIFGLAIFYLMAICNVPARGHAIVGFVVSIALATLSWDVTLGPLGFQGDEWGNCPSAAQTFSSDVVCGLWVKREAFVIIVMSQLGLHVPSAFENPGSVGLFVFVSGLLGLAILFPAFFVAWRLPSPQWRSLGVLFIFGLTGSVFVGLAGAWLAVFGIYGPFQIIWQTMLLVGVGFVVDRWRSPPPSAN